MNMNWQVFGQVICIAAFLITGPIIILLLKKANL